MGQSQRDLKRVVDAFVQAAIDQGWRVRRGGHGTTVYPKDPTQRPVVICATPQDFRGVKNLRSLLRRRGLEV